MGRKNSCKPKINDRIDLNDKINFEDTKNVPVCHPCVIQSHFTCHPLSSECNPHINECLICHKIFSFRQGLFKHKKQYHPKYDEDTKRIIDEINKTKLNDVNDNKINTIEQELLITKQKLDQTEKKLEEVLNNLNNKKDVSPTTINNMTNSHNNNLSTNVNIFTDYGDEKLEMLTLEDKQDICSQPCDFIYKIVKKMHINKDHPSYMNLCVENLRSNIMYAIEKNNFIAKDKSITLFDVIHTAGYRLREIIKNEESTKNIDEIQKGSLKTLHDFILRYDPTNEDLDGTIIL
jgi:hypothetical protein